MIDIYLYTFWTLSSLLMMMNEQSVPGRASVSRFSRLSTEMATHVESTTADAAPTSVSWSWTSTPPRDDASMSMFLFGCEQLNPIPPPWTKKRSCCCPKWQRAVFFCCAAHVRNTRAPEAETPKIPTLHSRNAHYTLCSMSCAGPEEEWEFTPEPRGHMCVTNFQEFLLLLSPFAPTHKRAHEWKKNFPYPSDPSLQPRSNDTTARDELGMSAKRVVGGYIL